MWQFTEKSPKSQKSGGRRGLHAESNEQYEETGGVTDMLGVVKAQSK